VLCIVYCVSLVLHNLHLTPLFRMNWRRWSPHILDIQYVARNATAVTNKIRRYYMGNKNPATASLQEIENVSYPPVGYFLLVKWESKNRLTEILLSFIPIVIRV